MNKTPSEQAEIIAEQKKRIDTLTRQLDGLVYMCKQWEALDRDTRSAMADAVKSQFKFAAVAVASLVISMLMVVS